MDKDLIIAWATGALLLALWAFLCSLDATLFVSAAGA
jgi:hypothetical protein